MNTQSKLKQTTNNTNHSLLCQHHNHHSHRSHHHNYRRNRVRSLLYEAWSQQVILSTKTIQNINQKRSTFKEPWKLKQTLLAMKLSTFRTCIRRKKEKKKRKPLQQSRVRKGKGTAKQLRVPGSQSHKKSNVWELIVGAKQPLTERNRIELIWKGNSFWETLMYVARKGKRIRMKKKKKKKKNRVAKKERRKGIQWK